MFNLLAPKEGMYVCKYVCIYTRPQVYVCTVMYVYIDTYIHTYIHPYPIGPPLIQVYIHPYIRCSNMYVGVLYVCIYV